MNDNPYMVRRAKRLIGTAGRRSEKKVAKRVGGRQTPASGAMSGAKGDVVLPAWLMECKSTVKDSIGIKHEWLSKIAKEALAKGKEPALTIAFTDAQGRPVANAGQWVCIPLKLWEELCRGE